MKHTMKKAPTTLVESDNLWPIGTRVIIKRWPVGGKVIGHHDGTMIIEPLPCTIDISDLEIDNGQ